MNRDDLGSPKQVRYGNAPRIRVSSQSWRRRSGGRRSPPTHGTAGPRNGRRTGPCHTRSPSRTHRRAVRRTSVSVHRGTRRGESSQ
ncbi:type I-E CRISPR-associated protein Cas7/Cse4/CasC [Streptomyces minutiscleroticus]|uniref:type I-E CRISPR-associated protein Cas7/Cse4/CasC n=1 Tax=Streptomyces minutiscleroticus TaxID=68238 RepID=UPI003D9DEC87